MKRCIVCGKENEFIVRFCSQDCVDMHRRAKQNARNSGQELAETLAAQGHKPTRPQSERGTYQPKRTDGTLDPALVAWFKWEMARLKGES